MNSNHTPVAKRKLLVRLNLRIASPLYDQLAAAWQEGGFDSESAFIREAIKEKLRRGEFEKRLEQRLYASISEQSKRLRGLQSELRLNFSGLTTLAKLFLLYFREPTGDVRSDNARTLDPRLEAFVRSLVEQYHGEMGALFDEVTNDKQERLVAAVGAK